MRLDIVVGTNRERADEESFHPYFSSRWLGLPSSVFGCCFSLRINSRSATRRSVDSTEFFVSVMDHEHKESPRLAQDSLKIADFCGGGGFNVELCP